jgi:hypothetical protein
MPEDADRAVDRACESRLVRPKPQWGPMRPSAHAINEVLVRAAEKDPLLRGLTIEMLDRLGDEAEQATVEWIAHHESFADDAQREMDRFWAEEEERVPAYVRDVPPIQRSDFDGLSEEESEGLNSLWQARYDYLMERYRRVCRAHFRIAASHAFRNDPALSFLTLERLNRIDRLRHDFRDLHQLAQEDLPGLHEVTPEAVRALVDTRYRERALRNDAFGAR